MNNYGPNIQYTNRPGHTHEFMGNTMIADNHNHSLAGISSAPIPVAGGHIHEISSNTSYDDNHIHRVGVRSGLQVHVSDNKHVHLIKGITTVDDGHSHNFEIATLI
jgi:hypothetical protein